MRTSNATATRRISRWIKMERRIIEYFRNNPTEDPDGSFIRQAWRLGYEAARRELKRKEKS